MVYFGAHLRYEWYPQSYQLLIGSGRIPQSVLGTSGGTRPPQSPRGYATGQQLINIQKTEDVLVL